MVFALLAAMRSRKNARRAGFTMVELIAALAIAGSILAMTAPFFYRMYKRNRLRSSVQEVYSLVLAARMQAVRRNQTVVLRIALGDTTTCPNTGQCAIMWADNVPNNFVQGGEEPTIQQYNIPGFIYFRYAPVGTGVNSNSAVSFDTYNGDAGLTNLIIFRGDGTIVPPMSTVSARPAKPGTYTAAVPFGSIDCNGSSIQRCRGIYMSDRADTGDVPNRNTFRISVDDFGSTGRASLLKWLPTDQGGNSGEMNYVPFPWVWSD